MTKEEREVMRIALEALESCGWNDGYAGKTQYFHDGLVDKAITAIEKCLVNDALEKKAENARELGLDYEPEKTVCPFCSSEWVTAEQHDRKMDRLEQEPVAWYRDEDGIRIYYETKYWNDATPLYTAPQPWEKFCDSNCVWTDHHPECKMAQRKPLTDEEINEFFQGMEPNNGFWLSFARAIEAAHGIKEKNT